MAIKLTSGMCRYKCWITSGTFIHKFMVVVLLFVGGIF